MPTTQHSDHRRTHSGCLQSPRRQRVANIHRLERLELQPEIIQYFLRDREIDLFVTRLTNQLKSYVSWRPDPHAVATGDGRILNRLESTERISVPTIQSHPTNINEGYK